MSLLKLSSKISSLLTCRLVYSNVSGKSQLTDIRYLPPGQLLPPGEVQGNGPDWSWNARGVYYRHHLSHHWQLKDHPLWVPSIHAQKHASSAKKEQLRRRARRVVKHAQHNEQWARSEYAWEADAWADVFGKLRDDPIVAWYL